MDLRPVLRPGLRVSYSRAEPGRPLADDVLLLVAFGAGTARTDDARSMRAGLGVVAGPEMAEVWRGHGAVRTGVAGEIHYAMDDDHFAGSIRIEESRHGSLREATESAYRALLELHAGSPYGHVWRIWNVIADINAGDGDHERYRQFCLGRAVAYAALAGGAPVGGYPAASAVGKTGADRSLELYWIAGHQPGVPIENPRQLSAYRYPRQYGPAAPAFARAVRLPAPLLLVSGTASIVGHRSLHHGDLGAQFRETMANLESLLLKAKSNGLVRSASLGTGSLVKAYVRHREDVEPLRRMFEERFEGQVACLTLVADICRSELLLEVEAIVPA